jgi:uncharacterized membrane-anchored protein
MTTNLLEPKLRPTARTMLNKVPEVTVFFWLIKVLATTVGETAADFLNEHVGLGLTGTSLVTAVLLAVVLGVQFGRDRYVPTVYWLVVVLISIVGTLITDNLTDNLGVPLEATAAFFTVALIAVFVIWYLVENTLSIHSITTVGREAFYWLAVLFTFALGTAAGDLVAEQFGDHRRPGCLPHLVAGRPNEAGRERIRRARRPSGPGAEPPSQHRHKLRQQHTDNDRRHDTE